MTEEVNNVEPKEPAEAPKTVAPKKNNLLLIGGIVGGIILVAACVLGYGFWNGSQIRAYGVFAENTFAVTKKWDKTFDESNLTKVKENIDEIKTESGTALVAVTAKSAPSKAKKLKADLIEYFTLSKKVAGDLDGIVVWAAEIEKIGTVTSSFSALDTASPEAMATSIERAKTDIDASIVKLDALTVPASMKEQNDAFKKMLKDLSVMYGKLATALRANDLAALTTLSSEFTADTTSLDTIKDPSDTLNETYKAESDRIDTLDKSITTGIAEMKNVGFSY